MHTLRLNKWRHFERLDERGLVQEKILWNTGITKISQTSWSFVAIKKKLVHSMLDINIRQTAKSI